MNPPTIKGLIEKCGTSEEDQERLRDLLMESALYELRKRAVILSRGGNLHGSNSKATAKRRTANKAAHKARKGKR